MRWPTGGVMSISAAPTERARDGDNSPGCGRQPGNRAAASMTEAKRIEHPCDLSMDRFGSLREDTRRARTLMTPDWFRNEFARQSLLELSPSGVLGERARPMSAVRRAVID